MLQKPLRRFLRVALLIPLFVGCFYTKDNENTHVKNVFRTLARLLGCLLLFFFANVLKTLVAKIMASHFHKEAHFEKMQEALQKVCAMEGPGVQALLCCAVLCWAGHWKAAAVRCCAMLYQAGRAVEGALLCTLRCLDSLLEAMCSMINVLLDCMLQHMQLCNVLEADCALCSNLS